MPLSAQRIFFSRNDLYLNNFTKIQFLCLITFVFQIEFAELNKHYDPIHKINSTMNFAFACGMHYTVYHMHIVYVRVQCTYVWHILKIPTNQWNRNFSNDVENNRHNRKQPIPKTSNGTVLWSICLKYRYRYSLGVVGTPRVQLLLPPTWLLGMNCINYAISSRQTTILWSMLHRLCTILYGPYIRTIYIHLNNIMNAFIQSAWCMVHAPYSMLHIVCTIKCKVGCVFQKVISGSPEFRMRHGEV